MRTDTVIKNKTKPADPIRVKQFVFILGFHLINMIPGFAQDLTRDQPDSIYKANHVKSKIEQTNGSYISKIITSYDKNGKAIEIVQFDTANRIDNRKVFEYDKDLKCRRTISYPHYYEDPVTKKPLDTPYVDSNYIYTTEFEYYQNNLLKSKTERKFNGELFSKESYTYNPKVEIEEYFSSNKAESGSKIFFSKNGLKTKELRQKADKTQKWDFTYSYKYNSAGQVIETKFDIKYSAISKKYYFKINYPVKETYEYFENGLFKTFTDFYENNITWVHNFTYEYY